MLASSTRPFRGALALALVLLAAAFAGCAENGSSPAGQEDGSGDGAADPFEAALAAPGPVLEPAEGGGSVRLKVLEPATPLEATEGEQTVRVLLYDADANAPVTDATFEIKAHMPAMGHGTAPEEAPVHEGDGIYEGFTTWSMPGEWELGLDAGLADGTFLEFDLRVCVGRCSGGDAKDDTPPEDPEGGSEPTLDEDGAYAPVNHDESTFRLRVLEPADTTHAVKGSQPVRVRLYDAATGDAVTDAVFEIKAWMPQMGHGTAPEEDPVHQADGEYEGLTTWSMTGDWLLNLDAALPDGVTLAFEVPVHVVEEGEAAADEEDTSHAQPGDYDSEDHSGHNHTHLYASFEEALNANGSTHAPASGNADVTLKLLEPVDPSQAPTGENAFIMLLYDASMTPITDATVTLASRMPAMGHGTSGEEDPAYDAHGVYAGQTNHAMEGDWIVDVTVTRADGTEATFEIAFTASDTGA